MRKKRNLPGRLLITLDNDSVEKMRVYFDRAYQARERGRSEAAAQLALVRATIYHYAPSAAS